MLTKLREHVQDGSVYLDKNHFRPEAVRFVREYIDEKIQEANSQEGLSMVEPLVVAEYIEASLLEKDTFKIFDSDAPELKSTLAELERETQEHLKEVKAKIQESKITRNI